MVFFISILSMALVYHSYNNGLVFGFITALFGEIFALLILYHLLKKGEERMRKDLLPLIEEQGTDLKRLEEVAEKRALALDSLLSTYPESLELVSELTGESFPRKKEGKEEEEQEDIQL